MLPMLFAVKHAPRAYVVVDLSFGDQGKGTVTDFLVRDRGARWVCRFNGGAQAGHNVVTDDGRHHTFAQFGAGSFVDGVSTFLARTMVLDPWSLRVEAEYLARQGVRDVIDRTFVDAEALVCTPLHGAINRLRERARGEHRHGSCGVGVGETMRDALTLDPARVLRAGDLRDPALTRRKLTQLREAHRDTLGPLREALAHDPEARRDAAIFDDDDAFARALEWLGWFYARGRIVAPDFFDAVLAAGQSVVFEGAQGVLLDEWRGFHPYTTWSTCTPHNADALLARFEGPVTRLGVLRCYATRHGAGPFVTEDPELDAALGEPHNRTDPWQGRFRVGHFDAVSARYARRVCGHLDALALTHLDRLSPETPWRVATRYRDASGALCDDLDPTPHGDLDALAALTRTVAGCTPEYLTHDAAAHLGVIEDQVMPVALASYGPRPRDKRWLRAG